MGGAGMPGGGEGIPGAGNWRVCCEWDRIEYRVLSKDATRHGMTPMGPTRTRVQIFQLCKNVSYSEMWLLLFVVLMARWIVVYDITTHLYIYIEIHIDLYSIV